MLCELCPRRCRVDRAVGRGFCGEGELPRLARAALHFGEEPCVSGRRGSGTVFFSGCTLRCVFCQNYEISSGGKGWEITPAALGESFLALQRAGAHNLNLVSPTPFLPAVRGALAAAPEPITVPLLWNSGGYERTETVRECADLFSVYMPDLKFCDPALSARYLRAEDYFARATEAILTMRELAGPPVFDAEGMLRSGVLVRHLVMPGAVKDSLRVIDWLCRNFAPDDICVSLLSQYLPMGRAADYPEINRRVTTYEYRKAESALAEHGFLTCYGQSRASAVKDFVPAWDGTGVIK